MRLLTPIFCALVLIHPFSAQGQDVEPMPAEAPAAWAAALRGTVDVEGGLMRLAAQREGLIVEVLVQEGDRVEAGQLLGRIDDEVARLQLAAAELELTQAQTGGRMAEMKLDHGEAELARLTEMAAAHAIPRKEIDQASQTVAVAKAEREQSRIAEALAQNRLAVAQLEVAAREIRAPLAGVILRSSARVGDATSTSTVTEMFLLAPDGKRVLRGMLDEQFVGQVVPGQSAVLISERMAGVELQGRVLRIAPIFGTPGQTRENQSQTETTGVAIVLSIEGEKASDLILGERLVARIGG